MQDCNIILPGWLTISHLKILYLPIASEIRKQFYFSHNHVVNIIFAFQVGFIDAGFEFIQKMATVSRIKQLKTHNRCVEM